MDIILWRHAEAHDAEDDLNDLGRRLTPRGEKQAQRMAAWLDRNMPESTRIYCSPAKRAVQSAEALGRKFKLKDELLPGAHWESLLELANWPEGRQAALLVGHQPLLGELVAQLLNIRSGNCSIGKGSVWWLRTRLRDADQQTRLVSVQASDML